MKNEWRGFLGWGLVALQQCWLFGFLCYWFRWPSFHWCFLLFRPAVKAVKNACPVQHGPSQSLTLVCPYRISSSNNWISRLLTSWGFLIHKVTANGNGSIILLAVKTPGECSPSLMNYWNYLHWKLRKILLADNYNRLSSLNNLKFHETSLLGTHFIYEILNTNFFNINRSIKWETAFNSMSILL